MGTARQLYNFEYDDVPTGSIFNTARMVFKFYYEDGAIDLMCTYIVKTGETKGVCVGGYIDETVAKEIIIENKEVWYGAS